MSELPSFGNCQALERLSQGPISDLYRASQMPVGRTVWVKVLRDDVPWSSSLADTLRREARFLGSVEHPAIQTLLEHVDEAPHLWLVLEAVDGHRLREILARSQPQAPSENEAPSVTGGRLAEAKRPGEIRTGASLPGNSHAPALPRLSTEGAIALGVQLADALAHLHERKLVYAALEPQHIIVSKTGHVVLCDLSRAVPIDQTPADLADEGSTGFDLPANMSPEQLQGYTVDARSDVFALGSLLCELLSHRGAFDSSPGDPLQRAEALSEVRPRIPAQLTRLVRRCMQREPSRRFATMHNVAEELFQLLPPEHRRQPERALTEALQSLGLPMASRAAARRPLEARDLDQRRAQSGLLRSLGGLLLTGAGLILGSVLLVGSYERQFDSKREHPSNTLSGVNSEGPSGRLRVVVEPWARVFVDGKLRATTPFAQPIVLRPGTHYLRLEHPDVAPIRRTVEIDSNEDALVSVVLPIALRAVDAGLPPRTDRVRDAAFSP